jgi:hypothetical protein
MEANVRKELEVLKGMVTAWRDSYQAASPADGEGDYLVHEFVEEIEIHVYPYARRLWECDHLSQAEADEFLDFCYRQVEELRSSMKLPTR